MATNKEVLSSSFDLNNEVSDLMHTQSNDEFLSESANFIDNRLSRLANRSEPKNIGLFSPHHTGFIHEESEIRSQALVPGFYVNDPEIYVVALTVMKDFHEFPTWQDPAKFRQLAFYSTQYALERYFGNTFTSSEQQAERNRRIWNNDIVSDDDHLETLTSISDFKNIALCTERAAAANNMLCLFGIEPEMVLGELQVEDKKAELHAFLITTNTRGEKLIFDPTHPHMFKKDDSLSLKPFIIPGGDDFLLGKTVDAMHADIVNGDEVNKEYKYIPSPLSKHV